jgi:predicted kinase
VKSKLIVIYGVPLSGKSTLAWELGRLLGTKTAVVSSDQLLDGAIAVPDTDHQAELEMAHIQLRLLVANYLKNGYNVIVEGPFIFERAGALYNYEADIDQLVALMRHLTDEALVVRLTAPAAVLASRAEDEAEASTALRIARAFKPRSGPRFQEFDTSTHTNASIARELLKGLESQS